MEEQTQKPRLQNISLIVVLTTLLVYGIALVANYMGSDEPVATAADTALAEKHTRPVAAVYLSEPEVPVILAAEAEEIPVIVAAEAEEAPASVAVASDGPDGEKIYAGTCFACHTSGAAGAPIPGSEAMSKRAEKGLDALLQSAVNGLNAMPPRGGRPDLSDEQVQAAIEFMLR